MTEEPPNGGPPADTLTPFERFERLTKQLVTVPKAKIDEAEAKRTKRRPRRAA